MAKSLLEKAIAVGAETRNFKPVTQEEIELAFGWVDGTISMRQVAIVIGNGKPAPASSVYILLARALRQGLNEGKRK